MKLGHVPCSRRPPWLFAGFLAGALGCTGAIDATPGAPMAGVGEEPITRPGMQPPASGPPLSVAERLTPTCRTALPGPAPLRRLTRFEYDNVVSDLFGVPAGADARWLAEGSTSGFDNDALEQKVTQGHVDQFIASAERVAEAVGQNLSRLLDCDPARAGAVPCADRFIDAYAPRAYRRPVTDAERSMLRAVFSRGESLGGFSFGLRLVVEAMLQSPAFMYRHEATDASGGLSDHALASRLAFLLWGSLPDERLMTLATEGRLRTPATLEAEARRLLRDPRSARVVGDFHRQWLGLDGLEIVVRDSAVHPGFQEGTGKLMREGLERFVSHLFSAEPVAGDLKELFSASYTFANARTAPFFDLAGPAPTGDAFVKVNLDPSRRGGLLTDAGLMTLLSSAAHTDIVRRGVFVRKELLCGVLAAPADEIPELPMLAPGLTTRELFTQHREQPSCAACHKLIDPIGFAFENYDQVGRYRTTENGKPVDTRGEVVGTSDADGSFDGALALSRRLAESSDVRACLVTKWFRYAFGRPEGPEDGCTLEELRLRFDDSGGKLRELLVAITQLPAFTSNGRPAANAGACTP